MNHKLHNSAHAGDMKLQVLIRELEFEYDDLNRLKEAATSNDCDNPASSPGDGDFDHSYTYDNLGNVKPTGDGYTYGTGTAWPHAPSAANGWTYS